MGGSRGVLRQKELGSKCENTLTFVQPPGRPRRFSNNNYENSIVQIIGLKRTTNLKYHNTKNEIAIDGQTRTVAREVGAGSHVREEKPHGAGVYQQNIAYSVFSDPDPGKS